MPSSNRLSGYCANNSGLQSTDKYTGTQAISTGSKYVAVTIPEEL